MQILFNTIEIIRTPDLFSVPIERNFNFMRKRDCPNVRSSVNSSDTKMSAISTSSKKRRNSNSSSNHFHSQRIYDGIRGESQGLDDNFEDNEIQDDMIKYPWLKDDIEELLKTVPRKLGPAKGETLVNEQLKLG